MKLSQKGAIDLMFVILLVVVLAVGGFVAWRVLGADETVQDTAANTESGSTVPATPQNEAKEEAEGESETTETPVVELEGTTGQIVTGQLTKNGTSLTYNFSVGSGLSEVWVEYGSSPDNLAKSTPHETRELALVFPDVYGGWSASIDANELPEGGNGTYFYRAMGIYDGATVQGGVVSFSYK